MAGFLLAPLQNQPNGSLFCLFGSAHVQQAAKPRGVCWSGRSAQLGLQTERLSCYPAFQYFQGYLLGGSSYFDTYQEIRRRPTYQKLLLDHLFPSGHGLKTVASYSTLVAGRFLLFHSQRGASTPQHVSFFIRLVGGGSSRMLNGCGSKPMAASWGR